MTEMTVHMHRDGRVYECTLTTPPDFDLGDPDGDFYEGVQRAFADVEPECGAQIVLTLRLDDDTTVDLSGVVRVRDAKPEEMH